MFKLTSKHSYYYVAIDKMKKSCSGNNSRCTSYSGTNKDYTSYVTWGYGELSDYSFSGDDSKKSSVIRNVLTYTFSSMYGA
jgi:hypothetical protein